MKQSPAPIQGQAINAIGEEYGQTWFGADTLNAGEASIEWLYARRVNSWSCVSSSSGRRSSASRNRMSLAPVAEGFRPS